MTESSQLGIYWGSESFNVVETINGQISHILQIPFNTSLDQQDNDENIPNELKFPTILKRALEFRLIKTKTANLSLPTNDLIFRSFVIPFMDRKDIHNVIEFEITKYIPIKLAELTYTYDALPIIQNDQKKLRILFIAIRKNRLQEMTQTIHQAGLELNNIEPAPVSLIHLLNQQNVLPKKTSAAVLQIGEEGGEVFVVKNGSMTFMRKLNIDIDQTDLSSLQIALQGEVSASFNFYAHQNEGENITKLIILSQHDIPNLTESLSKDLNINVAFLPIEKFIPIEDHQSILHLNALGTTLRKLKFSPKYFDFADNALASLYAGKDPLAKLKQASVIAGMILICGSAVAATKIIGDHLLNKNTQRIQELTSQLSGFEKLTAAELTTQKDDLRAKLKNYTNVTFSSSVSVILDQLPKLLPEGVWIENLQISGNSPSMKISLSGKIYSANPTEQFSILNQLIDNLKTDEKISVFYKNVNRDASNQIEENEYRITTFTVTCN